MIEAVVVIIGIGIALLFLGIIAANGLIAKNQAKIADAKTELVTRFGDGDYYTVLPGPRCFGIAWDQDSLVLGDSVEEAISIPLADVRSADIELDGVNVTNTKTVTNTKRGSQLAGGLLGGALLGPAGLIVGGLSGGSTSTGKAVETRKIKSVKLVVRIADRANPIRTFLFYDVGYGEGHEPTSVLVAPALEKASHFHALLQQVIEERPIQAPSNVATSVPTALIVGFFAAVGLMLSGLAMPSGADAYELAKAVAGKPEVKLTTMKPFDDVERCIVMVDLPNPPVVYRAPDGSRSLIHGGRSQPIFVFELIRSGSGADVLVWQGTGYVDKIQPCL